MSDPFIGEIRIFPYDFAPRGWASCNGQLLPIAQNHALFALLGTTYGGDGRVTFALPDLRGRVAVHTGEGVGLSPRSLGESGGSEAVTLAEANLPPHSHTVRAAQTPTRTKPDGAVPARTKTPGSYAATPDSTTMDPAMVSGGGESLPFPVTPPFLTLHFCIALEGIFPSRD
jgi:microcystin-dependent protein